MTSQAWIQLLVYMALLVGLGWPLGKWMAAVAEGRFPRWMSPFVKIENGRNPKFEESRIRVELHKRLSSPFYPIAAFIIPFAFIGSPQTTRQNRNASIAGAALIFMAIEIVAGLLAHSMALLADGSYHLAVGSTEMGNGSVTSHRQIAAQGNPIRPGRS